MTLFLTSKYINGRKCQVFKCSRTACRKEIHQYQDKTDANATKGLRDHVQSGKCWGAAVLESVKDLKGDDAQKATQSYLKDGSITAAFKRVNKGTVTYSHRQHSKMEMCAEIVCWVAESSQPFTIVCDHGFLCLMKTGRPGYYLPHPTTVSHDVKTVFAKTRQRISHWLRSYEGKLNFATDAWTSPNHYTYVVVTVHFEQEGIPLSLLLDSIELGKHSGENLAHAFIAILTDFGIDEKILSITCDNASNNNKMIEYLEKNLLEFPGTSNHTQCFNHIINLMAKSLLKLFDASTMKKNEDMDEVELALAELAADIDIEELLVQIGKGSDNVEAEDESDLIVDMLKGFGDDEAKELQQRIRPITKVLVKLQKISFKTINSSMLLLLQWYSILNEHEKKEMVIPRDVNTRWNSSFDILDYSCIHKRYINEFVNEDLDNGLSKFALRKAGFARFSQCVMSLFLNLRDADLPFWSHIFQILKDATVYFSCSMPNLATVILSMDYINNKFEKMIVDINLDPAIRAAVSLAKSEQKYSAASLQSLKLIVRREFDQVYKKELANEVSDDETDTDEVKETPKNRFDSLPSLAPPKNESSG
ncbi:hypothetical protein D9758_017115 [Tetrapyrgos nigripes]|uniref:Uncharacterized protein n=1 Tax=Tetrapyrgos nigripes TaxID=182062 RepID=A0A8H5FN15_9AGAR|nr:hypothetical protein D9758_017115 [Tetrapyrgos nigripes]